MVIRTVMPVTGVCGAGVMRTTGAGGQATGVMKCVEVTPPVHVSRLYRPKIIFIQYSHDLCHTLQLRSMLQD